VTLEVPAAGVALVGANAQGKTNFLEAIHFLEMLRSFRGSPDSQLIRFGAPFFRIEGDLAPRAAPAPDAPAEPPLKVAVAFQRGAAEGKRVRLNGAAPVRLGDALGHLGSVVFTPDDMRLISGGPQERRRFLDVVLSLNVPGYLASLQRYRQVLTRRNAALRAQQPMGAVRAWNPLLAEAGGALLAHRSAWVQTMAATFAERVEQVSAHESGCMLYRPGVPGLGPVGASESASAAPPPAAPTPPAPALTAVVVATDALREALEAGEARDRQRGVTLAGPHRDDLQLTMLRGAEAPARDLRDYGSGGQRRTAALALRLVEARTVERFRQRPPLLLLDDVFAELDEDRSRRILALLEQTAAGQVILTAPRDADVHFRRGGMALWRIEGGQIRPERGVLGGSAARPASARAPTSEATATPAAGPDA
jgi:DNA replication and repair protein RecF